MDVNNLTVDEIKELSWVQCENETCLKWRRISREELNGVGDKSWFCSLNRDLSHNKCEHPEEDHRKTIHTANKCGYRYVFSQLPQGSLVWAKMTGYVRWPAILSPDPTDGSYVLINKETGTPSEYHVEFLGRHHSHYWVHSSNIDVYGSSSAPQTHKISKRGKKTFGVSAAKPKKSEHHTKGLQASIDEAEPLKTMTCEDRLKKCVFTYRPKPEKNVQQNETDPVSKERQPVFGSPDKDAGNRKTGNVKLKRGRPAHSQRRECCTYNTSTNIQSSQKSKKTVSFHMQPEVQHLPTDDLSVSSSDDDLPIHQVDIRTKEERLQADIQLLKRAEEKFERRLRKFSVHHGIPVKSSGPQWQGRQVSRYQVYMAVQERGGFNMVSANRAWAKVYNDVCGTSPGPRQSVSTAVKSYYTRNLLPYELYELRSSGDCASRSASSNTKYVKKHKKHNKTNKLENHRTRASCTSYTGTTEAAALGQTCRPVDGDSPVNFQPMGGVPGFHQPIRVQNPVCQPIGGQENSERALTGSQGGHCAAPTHEDLNTGQYCSALTSDADAGAVDVDLLQEESKQALQELQAMENMLTTINQNEYTTISHQNSICGLDRPTHIETKPYASPLSSRKPVLLEFYSMQYDEGDCTLMGTPPNTMRVNDDTHQVPDIVHPIAETPSSLSASLPLPGRPVEDGTVCPDIYSNVLLDIDAMGDEIDRLNDELHHHLMEI